MYLLALEDLDVFLAFWRVYEVFTWYLSVHTCVAYEALLEWRKSFLHIQFWGCFGWGATNIVYIFWEGRLNCTCDSFVLSLPCFVFEPGFLQWNRPASATIGQRKASGHRCSVTPNAGGSFSNCWKILRVKRTIGVFAVMVGALVLTSVYVCILLIYVRVCSRWISASIVRFGLVYLCKMPVPGEVSSCWISFHLRDPTNLFVSS